MIEEQIKPSELRIGNYVKTDLKDSDFDNNIYQIETIANEFPTLNTVEFGIGVIDWNNIKPIPLTEEWLVKFGFEKDDAESHYLDIGKSAYLMFYENNGVVLCDNYDNELNWIKYVHSLQNLYFALTNEELKITE